MRDAGSKDIIIIKRVCRRAISHGRPWCRCPGALTHHGRGPFACRRLIASAGYHAGYHVFYGMFCAGERKLGPLGWHLGRPFRELMDDRHETSASRGWRDV